MSLKPDPDTAARSHTAFADFLEHILDTARADNPGGVAPAALETLSKAFWEASATRLPGQTHITVTPAGLDDASAPDVITPDVITIVTDDRAFLVDSVIGQISALGLEIEALFHPIVNVRRDANGARVSEGGAVTAESMMLVLLQRQTTGMQARLKRELTTTLADTQQAVADYEAMRALMGQTRQSLGLRSADIDAETLDEALSFLDWLYEGKFVFLGARSYDFTSVVKDKKGKLEPEIIPGSNLGVLRDIKLQVLRDASEPTQISAQGRVLFTDPDPVTIAKSNLQSRVHRRVRMDYVSVKHYGDDGDIVGETRFVGLFTADAYNLSANEVPLLRRKVARVRQRSKMSRGSHAAKRLAHVLSTYPRDELFQISEDDLLRISTGIVHVLDRPRSQIFVRRDPFDRFVSVLAYVPREHYSTKVRMRIGEHLRAAYDGRLSAFYPHYSDEPVARVHFIIGVEPFAHNEPDIEDLQTEIAAWPRHGKRGLTGPQKPWARMSFQSKRINMRPG